MISPLAALAITLVAPEFPPDAPRLWPREYLCMRAPSTIQIDGKITDDAWKTADWTADFVDIEADKKPKPKFRTRAKMLWDDDWLYIAAELEEPHVWGTLTRRDSVVFHDNDFEVFIDPDGDNHGYYEMEMNALNTVWDLYLVKPYRDGGPVLFNWDYKRMRTAVHVDGTLNDPSDKDKGWTVEIAIPWNDIVEYQSQLKQDGTPPPTVWRPSEGTTWRIGFSRIEWEVEIVDGKYRRVPNTPEYNWLWSPQGVIDMHRPETWGYVQFTLKPKTEAKLVPDPAKPAREVLHRVYYAAKPFRTKNGRWPKSSQEIGVKTDLPGIVGAIEFLSTSSQFEARAKVRYPEGSVHTWAIAHDSRIWEIQP